MSSSSSLSSSSDSLTSTEPSASVDVEKAAPPDEKQVDPLHPSRERSWKWIAGLTVVNVVLLVARVLTVCVKTQYLVHAVVVWIDLLLLSIAKTVHPVLQIVGFMVCFVSAALYNFASQEIVFELLETTLLALTATIANTYHRVWEHRAMGYLPKREAPLVMIVGEVFDGSSGVLYTSFLGLVAVELMTLSPPLATTLFCVSGDEK